MRPPTGSGHAAQGEPPFEVNKVLYDLETAAAPGLAIEGPTYEVPLVLVDRQEELAEDIFELVADLKFKLERYLAFRTSGTPDDTVKLDTESAIEWVDQTIGDLVATIVGIEAMSRRSADPVAS